MEFEDLRFNAADGAHLEFENGRAVRVSRVTGQKVGVRLYEIEILREAGSVEHIVFMSRSEMVKFCTDLENSRRKSKKPG